MFFSSRTPAADKPSSASGETAAEKLRKALDQVRDLEIAEQPLDDAVNQLREQTGINFTIDRTAVPAMLSVPTGTFSPVEVPSTFHKFHVRTWRMPLRLALSRMLRKHNLTHVLVGDTVLITTPDKAAERQLGQTISINIKDVVLSDALKQLARETGANLLLDPRAAKEGQTALTLRLDEVSLETAVELLADEADLRAVRLGNVLYVTSEARARKLQKPRPAAAAPPRGWQIRQDYNGGFRLTPLSENGGDFRGDLPDYIASLASLTPPPSKKDKPSAPEKPNTKTPPTRTKDKESLADKLHGIVDFKGYDDPKMTLAEALDDLKKKYGLPCVINQKAFEFENVVEVDKVQIASTLPVSEFRGPLFTVLRKILARVPAPSGAALRLRGDHVEITTGAFLKELRKIERESKTSEDKESPNAKSKESLTAKLLHRVDFPGIDDPKTTLDEVLADLAKKYDLSFLFNEKAFKFDNLQEAGKTEIASPNSIPAMKNVRLATVLRVVLGRIPVPSGATFLVRREFIEITTGAFLQGEVWADDPEGPHLPIVQVAADKQSFDEVIRALAEQANYNILLDARLGDKAKTPLSAELYNVPLDTAVRLLAGMVELRMVHVDNVLYVTDAETAETIGKARPKKPLDNAKYSWTISGPSGTLIRVPNE
jgi:hypothetical protein